MKSIRLYLAGLFLLSGPAAWAAAAGPVVSVEEPWSNITAGKAQEFHLRVTSDESFSGRVVWRFQAGSAVLARGERAVTEREPRVAIQVDVPPLKPGAAMAGSLSAAFVPEGREVEQGRIEKNLWFLSDAPFAEQGTWTRDLKIRLFDPEKKTAAVFDKSHIAYEALDRLDLAGNLKDGILVIGEGVSTRDYKGLPDMANKAAQAGVNVLVLASAEKGEWPLPLAEEEKGAGFRSVTFRREEVVRELDKRLDARGWAPDGRSVATVLSVAGERGQVAGEFRGDGAGWPWVEMKAAGGGRVILCGFAIVRKWDLSPTPAFLLVKVLQELDKGNKAAKEGETP